MYLRGLIVLAALLGPTTGLAQPARPKLNIEVTWEGPAPQIVLQAPDIGSKTIPNERQPVRIDQLAGRWGSNYGLVIGYPGAASKFVVLARSGEPTYGLRLRSPLGQRCDNNVVSPLVRQARSDDLDALVNVVLVANYLTRPGNECSNLDRDRLQAALVDAHCSLAVNTTVFSVPNVSGAPNQQARQCQSRIVRRDMSTRTAFATERAFAGDRAAMEEALADVRSLAEVPEGREAFLTIGETNLRRIEVSGLLNARRVAGNEVETQALSVRLGELSRRADYEAAFRLSGLGRASPRRIESRAAPAFHSPPVARRPRF